MTQTGDRAAGAQRRITGQFTLGPPGSLMRMLPYDIATLIPGTGDLRFVEAYHDPSGTR
ncbi:hypothetical protein FRC08_016186 [Ceratobasidium sp. 394]|nr:hypothetical protein FRC08_016186 [Ceratobasidium sp. 394]